VGVHHEFINDHSFTVDVSWIDFSAFRLSEFYFDGNALAENDTNYDDVYAVSVSYTWPVSARCFSRSASPRGICRAT